MPARLTHAWWKHLVAIMSHAHILKVKIIYVVQVGVVKNSKWVYFSRIMSAVQQEHIPLGDKGL